MGITTTIILSFIPLLLSLSYFSAAAAPPASNNFIKTSCSTTRYPALCVQSLSVYANQIQRSPQQLALTALNVSLDRAQLSKTFVKRLTKFKGLKHSEYAAINDCCELLSDTVDQLNNSIQEIKNVGRTGRSDFLWHMSNVETWASAALTDESTCMDGFSGKNNDGKIKSSVRKWVTHVAEVTSNALALVNQFAATR